MSDPDIADHSRRSKEFLDEGLSKTGGTLMKALGRLEDSRGSGGSPRMNMLSLLTVISSAEASSNLVVVGRGKIRISAAGQKDSASMMAMSRGEGSGSEVSAG